MKKQLSDSLNVHSGELIAILVTFSCVFLVGCWSASGMIINETEVIGSAFVLLKTVGMIALLYIFPFIWQEKYYQQFTLALSFGQTRKEFMTVFALRQGIWISITVGALMIISFLESLLYRIFLHDRFDEIYALIKFQPLWLLAIIPVFVILSMFLGTLFCKFGRRFSSIINMIFCLSPFLIRICISNADASVFSHIASVEPIVWLGLCAVLAAGMVFVIIKLGMRYTVK